MNKTDRQYFLSRALCVCAKAVRIITVPPVMAAALVLLLHGKCGAFSGMGLWTALSGLAVLPLLSYGIWFIVPALRAKGRKSQRTAAVICSCTGYLLSSVYCLINGPDAIGTVAVLTYLFSGLMTAFLSYVCKLKSSGHACGLSGPVMMAAVRVHPLFLTGYLLLIPVIWSSLKLKRHTWTELLCGAAIPVSIQFILVLIFG